MATMELANPTVVPGQVSGAEIALTLRIGDDSLGNYTRYGTTFVKMDAAPVVVGDRTFLPARAVIEALGATAPTTSISHKGEVAGAKVLAGTILDLLEGPELVAQVREYFLEENKGVKYE